MSISKKRTCAFVVLIAISFPLLLAACGRDKPRYYFEAVTNEIAMQAEASLDVRLVDEVSGNAVEGAVIFESRFDMSPDGMATMTAPAEAQGSPQPGIYRFKVAPNMAGRWALALKAKLRGVEETISGTVVVRAR